MNSLLFITRVSGDLISWEESVNPLNQWIYRIWEYEPMDIQDMGIQADHCSGIRQVWLRKETILTGSRCFAKVAWFGMRSWKDIPLHRDKCGRNHVFGT